VAAGIRAAVAAEAIPAVEAVDTPVEGITETLNQGLL
jgi:hypothetical protein